MGHVIARFGNCSQQVSVSSRRSKRPASSTKPTSSSQLQFIAKESLTFIFYDFRMKKTLMPVANVAATTYFAAAWRLHTMAQVLAA
eukprot:3333590-Pleurochrysis_carterae.AAC.2